MVRKLLHYYKLANILSLDVAAGAVVCAVFFSKIFDVEIRINAILSLAACVWMIYTADHLIDIYGIQHQASTTRHRFHQRNRKLLTGVLLLVFAVTIPQLFFIRKAVLLGGVTLSILILFYFLYQKNLKHLKEVFGAVLYTGGVLLVPLSLRLNDLHTPHIILMIQFFSTALLNLLLFSWFDYEKDSKDHRESFVTARGVDHAKKILVILFIINGILPIFLIAFYTAFAFASIVIFVMNLILALLFFNKAFFDVNDRYRIIGDAIFLLPLIHFFELWS